MLLRPTFALAALALTGCLENPGPQIGEPEEAVTAQALDAREVPGYPTVLQPVRLGANCASPLHDLAPNPGEEGEMAAARITPPRYPFTVSRVEYPLWNLKASAAHPYACSTAFAHRVVVFKARSTVPPDVLRPEDTRTINVPGRAGGATLEDFNVALPTSLTLQAGEQLFVAVSLGGQDPTVGCMAVCPDAGVDPTRSWWSNAVALPFAWTTLASFGLSDTPVVTAWGL
jgi:hypothetical protein